MSKLAHENPEHLLPYEPIKPAEHTVAVAIEADHSNPNGHSKIVATGRGKLAQQILEIAFANDVKVRTDSDLAELLATFELDTPIPSEAIVAVAEILAKVYEANAAAARAAESPL